MARVLYLDCFSGAAGDMLLGALLEVGVPLDALRAALGTLGVDHRLEVARVVRAGIVATKVNVVSGGRHGHGDHEHRHDEHHHDHAHDHHSLADIRAAIGRSALSPAGKARASGLFQRLGEAEAAIHDLPIEQIHLHEVGAIDSIIDVVGAVFALEHLGIEDVVASPLNVGGGTVHMAHGTFPVPAPATVRLLEGVPVYSSGVEAELVTPTGALVVSDYARSYGPVPPMTIERVGYGAGARDLAPTPNVLRAMVGTRTARRQADDAESVLRIECEIDDMNPQLYGPLQERLFAAGAVDVFLTAVQMKKGRPGTLVTVLAAESHRAAVADVLFRETTTLGIRFDDVRRETLDRTHEPVTVHGQTVRIKVARRGGVVMSAAPEFDDCVRIAEATDQPVKQVLADALHAWGGRKTAG